VPPTASLAATEQVAPDLEQLEQLRPALHEMYAELRVDYPQHLRQPLIDAKVSDEWLRVGIAERGRLAELATELRAGSNIPDVPVIALTVVGVDPARQEMHDGKTRMDAAVVSAVSHGEQRILSDTLHHRLCFDRPDAVVQAIRDVVDRTTCS
jgi:hypothetical protein